MQIGRTVFNIEIDTLVDFLLGFFRFNFFLDDGLLVSPVDCFQ